MAGSFGKDINDVRLCLLGFGSVGHELLAMLRDVEERIASQCGVRFLIAGVTTRHDGFLDPAGVTAAQLLGMVESGHGSLPGPAVVPAELIAASGADVLVEATVLEPGGGTAADHIEAAFAAGMDAVTVNKGPVAWQFKRMQAAAQIHGRRWRYEGTVADGMPVFDLVETCLRGCTITGFDGILTGVTNYILDALGEGDSFDDAVAHTRREGWLEADPALDLDGVDSACKLAILATSRARASEASLPNGWPPPAPRGDGCACSAAGGPATTVSTVLCGLWSCRSPIRWPASAAPASV
jgi:homoserine dehydrogenase